MTPLLKSITKRFAYLLAAVVIIAATAVVVTRTLSPYLDARRPQIERWASNLLHAPINIEKAGITWYIYEPGVVLHNVTLLDDDNKTPVLQLRTVKVFFSIPQSLLQHKLVYSGVAISGAEIVINEDKEHGFTVQGFPQFNGNSDKPYSVQTKAREVLGFVFSQPRLRLRDIDVRYTGIKGLKRLVTLYNLKIQNDGSEHEISGKAILHQAIPTELSVAATFTGDEPDPAKIKGKIYLNVSGLSLDQWLQGLEWHGWSLNKGLLGAKIWATWADGGLNRIQSSFQLYDVKVYSAADKSTHAINRLSGDVGWKKEQQDQIVAGDDILIDWSTTLWPVTSFYLKLSPDGDGVLRPVTMNIGYLNIVDTHSMLSSFESMLPKNIDKFLHASGISGNLEKIRIAFSSKTKDMVPVSIDGDFNKLAVKSTQSLPGFSGLSGGIHWEHDKGSIQIKSSNSVIEYPSVFVQPIKLDTLVGKVAWTYAGTSINVIMREVLLMNQDLAMNLAGNITVPESLRPEVDLNANFTVHHAQNITRYLPQKTFSNKLNDWLDQAFISGDVQSGSLLVRGPLYDFPFEKGNGQFVISGAVNNVQLHYAPDWPDIKDISGTLKFDRNQVIVDVNHARLLNISIPQTHAEIPALSSDNVKVNVSGKPIQTDLKDALEFIHKSPLDDSVGRMFKKSELSGPADINLSLGIPLDTPEKTNVSGVINVRDGQFALKPWKLEVQHLQGRIDFTQDSTRASGVQGELFGKSLQLNIETLHVNKPDSLLRLTIDNSFELADLQKWLQIPLDKVARGSTRAQTRIDIAKDKPIQINLSSNLLGVTLDLPEQYAKPEDEQRQFDAEILIEEGKPLKLKLTYSDLLRAAMILKPQGESLSLQAVNLHLGGSAVQWPEGDGLFITGNLKKLSWEQIKKYAATSGSESGIGLPLKNIKLDVEQLDVMNIDLGKSSFEIDAIEDGWLLDIDSSKITGRIKLPTQLDQRGNIVADLKYLNLDALSELEKGGEGISAAKLPAVDFSSDEVEYYSLPLSKVKLVTRPHKNGMQIKLIAVDGKTFKFHGEGSWIQQGDTNITKLKGDSSTINVTDLLEDLEFDAHNFLATNGKIEFDLSWKNAPYDLSLKTITGKASLDIGRGRIVELSGTSNAQMDLGRMLNIFSLQTIPRRLSLDFSDMFEKGYSFDYLRGDYSFDDGDIVTNNMQFDGPVAKVNISGKIGLVDEDFDLKLNVKPYVTSSIPVAATLITGQPVIGVAALIVNKILSGEVSKAATYSYEVKGPWNDPQWTKIKDKRNKTR